MRWVLAVLTIVGCDAKPVDDVAPVDLARSTAHGPVVFGDSVSGEVTGGGHLWSFKLSAPSSIHAFFRGVGNVDAMIYLFDHSGVVARDADELERELPAGEYRVLVKTSAATRGRFTLTVDCDGVGCSARGAGPGMSTPDRHASLTTSPNIPSHRD